jgi:hypothetical protein
VCELPETATNIEGIAKRRLVRQGSPYNEFLPQEFHSALTILPRFLFVLVLEFKKADKIVKCGG